MTDSDVAVEETKPVSGWSGRYRTKGKAYVEIYDSQGSFRRAVRNFEVITEQKSDDPIRVVDFTSK